MKLKLNPLCRKCAAFNRFYIPEWVQMVPLHYLSTRVRSYSIFFFGSSNYNLFSILKKMMGTSLTSLFKAPYSLSAPSSLSFSSISAFTASLAWQNWVVAVLKPIIIFVILPTSCRAVYNYAWDICWMTKAHCYHALITVPVLWVSIRAFNVSD